MSTDPVATLRDELRSLERAYSIGHHGRWSAAKRADAFDACLRSLFAGAQVPGGVAVVALGGYGRRLQLPGSDVDVLLLHDDLGADRTEKLASAMFYPLWDAGFSLGQAVRTPAECLQAGNERLDNLTAMLDARVIAGDADLAEGPLEAVRAIAAHGLVTFASRLRVEAERRSERFGSAAHHLEPDLKEGAGGLRDVASLGWLTAARGEDLVAASLLHVGERDRADSAEEFMVRARSAVHLLTGKHTDRLVSDLQRPVAEAMGFTDGPNLPAADGLMRALFEHARNVEHAARSAIDRASGQVAAVPSPVPTSAADVLAILAEAAERDQVVAPAALDAIGSALGPDPVAWDDAVRAAFLRLLRLGERGIRALDALDRQGWFELFVSSWEEVRCRPQRDPYHRFTVDAHLTSAVSRMVELLERSGADDDPLAQEMVNLVDHPDPILLGAFLHDIGKVGRGNHVALGAEIAVDTLRTMGYPAATRELTGFMVAEHLLLPDTATRRDLTEENLIMDVAARVGTAPRLAALYLLAEADALATGPAAWTPWRQALIRELVVKVQHVLERGDMGQELAQRLADRIDRLRDLLVGEPEAAVDRFVLQMPRGYFLSVEPARAARHFHTVAPPLGTSEVRSASAPGTREGTFEVLVVAADRPGVLSWIAGALAVCGISILSAQVFTTDDGAAVDLFEVQGAFEPEIGEARWREFRSVLRKAIDGSISLERRVEDKRRHYPKPTSRIPVTVRVDNGVSDFSTVIEVGAPDRIGLLYDITRVFADLHLDVHLAKVATYEDRVIDAFYVRDGLGRKITVAAQLDEVEVALRERLGG